MEKQRSIKVLSVVALIVAVLGLTVAFAALSETLNITGAGSVKGRTPVGDDELSTWSVYFDNLDVSYSSKDTSNIKATSNGYSLSENKLSLNVGTVSLSLPGDTVTYTFDIVNASSSNAILTAYDVAKPVCKDSKGSSESEDATNVCSNLVYSLTYDDGSEINVNDELARSTSTSEFNSKGLKLVIGYDNDATFIPNDDVTITFDIDGEQSAENSAVKMIYSQK